MILVQELSRFQIAEVLDPSVEEQKKQQQQQKDSCSNTNRSTRWGSMVAVILAHILNHPQVITEPLSDVPLAFYEIVSSQHYSKRLPDSEGPALQPWNVNADTTDYVEKKKVPN